MFCFQFCFEQKILTKIPKIVTYLSEWVISKIHLSTLILTCLRTSKPVLAKYTGQFDAQKSARGRLVITEPFNTVVNEMVQAR